MKHAFLGAHKMERKPLYGESFRIIYTNVVPTQAGRKLIINAPHHSNVDSLCCRTNAHLPMMTPDNYRVYVCKMTGGDDFDVPFMFIYYKYIIMVSVSLLLPDFKAAFAE